MAEPTPSSFLDQLARGWRGYALVALIALCAALPGVSRMPVLDRDEARFVQATRQMLETDNYVRIRNQQDDRNKKPIGIHWLQAAAVTVTEPLAGKQNAIWTYRIPSVLGAILAALAAFWAGTALIDRRAALLGSTLFGATILLGTEGMIAKTDAMLAGLTTLTLAALAHLWMRKPESGSKALVLTFWIALGAGVLIKGPVTPLAALLTILAVSFWEKRWAWLKPLAWWPGPLLAVLIVAPWMIAIGLATNGQFFAEAFGGDLAPKIAGGQEGHFAWPGYHLLLLPVLIFPATFLLPAAARLGWRTLKQARGQHDPLTFLIAWIVPSFLLFELMPTKLAHYTLPTYPAIALLGGAAMLVSLREKWRITAGLGVALFALGGALVVAVLAYGTTYMPGDEAADLRRAIQAALLGAGAVGGAMALLMFGKRPELRAGGAILAALALAFMLRSHVLPEARALHVSAEATAALARVRLSPTDTRPLWVVGYRETSLVFLTRTDIRLGTPFEVGSRALPGDVLMIESRDLAATEAELASRGLVFARRGAPVSGHNYGNGKRVDLYIGEVSEIAR